MNRRLIVAVLAIAAAGALAWWWTSSPREREIRRRLDALAAEMNGSGGEGLGGLARAARIGQYFTADVVIELGQGTAPIQGRDTLMGMAARLQPRTAAFELELKDVTVERSDDESADVAFTALIRRRTPGSGEESVDAREFSAGLRHADGDWRVARVTAIDTLR